MNAMTLVLFELQEGALLAGRAFRGAFTRPLYLREILRQMDILGVGSLSIVLLSGFFAGGIIALQVGAVIISYGALQTLGQIVMAVMVRALGPVLTCIMLSGRAGSGIAAELGSMVVTEQIDALRALGTSPIKKLVWPRMSALMIMAPALTVLCDLMAAFGGWVVSTQIIGVASATYINSAKQALTYNDIVGGIVKPFVYGFIIAIVGCRFGLRTVGGTVGVGRSTTQCVVTASILIISTEFFLSKLFIALGDLGFLK